MPLAWPGISNVGGDLPDEQRQEISQYLDSVADRVRELLASQGLPPAASPLSRPFGLITAVDAEKVVAVFVKPQGIATLRWLDQTDTIIPPEALVRDVQGQLGLEPTATILFPKGVSAADSVAVNVAAQHHVAEVERAFSLTRVGDLTGLTHLEPHLRQFLADHPDPARNVFLMMRFLDSPQMRSIEESLRNALQERGFTAIRADDRDYTGELWTNVELCMVGSHLGVTVFEDIEQREFNPNISLELGYMLARRHRCLILKERRLPDLPTDVVHRLYKPFDAFNIEETVRAQVLRWIDVDLNPSTA